MTRLALPHELVEVVGALELEMLEGGGVRPRRLPLAAVRQSTDAALDLMSQMTCGVRLRFATTGSEFTIAMKTLRLEVRGAGASWPTPMASVLVNGAPHAEVATPEGDLLAVNAQAEIVELVGGDVGELRVIDLPPGLNQVEVWLPQGVTCALHHLDADGVQRPAPDSRPRWWHYGSSISHGFEAPGPRSTWPAIAADIADLNLMNLALAGQAMLDPFVARAIAASDADVVSLCLGINIHNSASMTLRTFEPALHGFLDLIRDRRPDLPLHVISPVPFPAGEHMPGPVVAGDDGVEPIGGAAGVGPGATTLTVIRDTVERVVRTRMLEDAHLSYVDGRDLLAVDEVDLLVDGLHPGPEGLRRIGERFGRYLSGTATASR